MALHIRDIVISSPIALAPMAGVTDSVFRRLVKRFGVGLVYTELISCMGIVHGDKRTLELTRFDEEERPIAIQIFGNRPYEMSEAAKIVEYKLQPDILDINLGCSVPKMGKSGGGAFLCRDLSLLEKVFKEVRKAVSIPLTVKIRIGWDEEEVTAFSVAKMAQDLGIDAITIHGRTSKQRYSGRADWESIKSLKETVSIPVIGNGDIATPDEAVMRLESSGCDAIMIGRASIGNPWIFRGVKAALDGGLLSPSPTFSERRDLVLAHLKMAEEERGERGILEMRRHLIWYLKGLPYSAGWKEQFTHVHSFEEVRMLINTYFSQLIERQTESCSSSSSIEAA